MDDEDVGKKILKKYDEEIDGERKSSFTIGMTLAVLNSVILLLLK